jgi:cytochrome c-type biogenesis protein
MTEISIFAAFGAGLLSFISPCCLPLYPGFLSYITGVSVDELKQENGMIQRRAILHTTFFLIGFSIIFIFLGMSTSFIGEVFYQYRDVLRRIGAILIFFFGLVVIGLIQPKFLMRDRKMTFKTRPSGYFGSVVIGTGYAAGWTPCTGPILMAVLAMATANPELGMWYMVAYVLGFAVPFFVMSFFIGKMKWIKRNNRKIMKFGGFTMIFMSFFLYFGWMTQITSFLVNRVFGGFQGF